MSQYCYPCVLSEIIFPESEYCQLIEQDNQWSNWLRNQAEEFIPKMKVPFGSYPKTKYFVTRYNGSRELFTFFTTIHSEDEAIKILKNKAEESKYIHGRPYSITKKTGSISQVIFRKEYKQLGILTKFQKEFILANYGTLNTYQLVKILNLSHWVVYSFLRNSGLVKPKIYHGNRKNQEIIIQ